MPIEIQWRSLFDQAHLQENEDETAASDYADENSEKEVGPIVDDEIASEDDFGFGDTGDEDFPEVK